MEQDIQSLHTSAQFMQQKLRNTEYIKFPGLYKFSIISFIIVFAATLVQN